MHATRKAIDQTSLRTLGQAKLEALCQALELTSAHASAAAALFDLVSWPWGDCIAGATPIWTNDITDDCTPFELSVSFRGEHTDLRMLFESQMWPLSPTSTWQAGLDFGKRLRAAGKADLTLFERVCDLFAPRSAESQRFLLWHAAVLRDDGPPLFKAYLNPEIHGGPAASLLIERALKDLELAEAWQFVAARLRGTDPEATRIPYFSLDLEDPKSARAKIYITADSSASVERLLDGSERSIAVAAKTWLKTLTGSEGPYRARPMLVCLAFRRGAASPDVTLHVPIRGYVQDDEEAASRVSTLLNQRNVQRLECAMEAVSGRPLSAGRGALTYASLQAPASSPRVTVYLAPEIHSSPRAPQQPSGTHALARKRSI
jgi:hypothetical protein